MLWVDDTFVTKDDLESLDEEIPEIAEVTKLSTDRIIARSMDDCRNFLSRFMSFSNFNPKDLAFRDVNIPINTPGMRFTYAGFAQLVVSGNTPDIWSPLKNWAANKALLKFYKAATNKMNDRYSDRFQQQQEEVTGIHWPTFKRFGLPIIFAPLPAPGAIYENTGRFTDANVSLVDGAGSALGDVEFAITWVSGGYVSGSNKNNGESYNSKRIKTTLVADKLVSVGKGGLVAPDGRQPKETIPECRYNTAVATGWNVWAGMPGQPLYRQNNVALALSVPTFTLPADPVFAGETMDQGQVNDVVLEINTELVRC